MENKKEKEFSTHPENTKGEEEGGEMERELSGLIKLPFN